jgi:hypothetical protein
MRMLQYDTLLLLDARTNGHPNLSRTAMSRTLSLKHLSRYFTGPQMDCPEPLQARPRPGQALFWAKLGSISAN